MFSQAEEDDVLADLLGLAAGIERGTFVEIGVGVGVENNTRALAYRPGWHGHWLGDEYAVDVPDTIDFQQVTVTPDNVLGLLAAAGVTPPVDVFSIDIDGNDYWVAAAVIPWLRPRIVIVENNALRDEPWIMPYTSGYRWHAGQPCGASLAAWELLLARDYDLVYTTAAQVNAFFVRKTVDAIVSSGGGTVNDTLQDLIDGLRALIGDLQKNEGRPSAQEIINRVGRAATLAEVVQQNLRIAATPIDPALAGNVVLPAGTATIADVEAAMDNGTLKAIEPNGDVVLSAAAGADDPPYQGAGALDPNAELPPQPADASVADDPPPVDTTEA